MLLRTASLPRRPGRLVRLGLTLVLLGAGCRLQERYLVDRQTLVELQAKGEAQRAAQVVPAVRERDGKRVGVQGDALPLAPSAWLTDPVSVRTSAPAPMVTAGAVLTVVGSILSIGATSTWLATRNSGRDALSDTALGLTISAEPIMITGTVLWILGTLRRPQEAPLPVAAP